MVATGPSLSLADARSVAMFKQERPDTRVIAISDAVYPFWFADICYSCDAQWWQYHKGLPGFGGLKMRLYVPLPNGTDTNPTDQFQDIETVISSGVAGYDDNPGYIRHGGNSGYQALHVAAKLGATKVILLGFDMKYGPKRESHWFGDHPRLIRKAHKIDIFIERFDVLGKELSARGIVVLNASRDSALKAFRKVDLEATLKGELQC